MLFRLTFTILLLIVLLFVVNRTIDLQDLPHLLLTFPRLVLIELLFISSMISVLKAWRFLILLRNTKFPVSFWATLKTFVASQAITPLPGGEAARGILLHHETGSNILKTTGPVVTQAYLELISATILAAIGALVFKAFRIPTLMVLLILIAIAFIITNKKIMTKLSQKTARIKFMGAFLKKLQIAQVDIKANFYDHKSGLPDKVLVRTLGLSFLSQILGGILVYIIAQTYNANLNLLQSIFVSSTGMVIQGIGTFAPGGLGLTEGGMTGVLLFANVDFSQAVAIVLIFRVTTLLFNIVVGLVFLALFYSKPLLLKSKIATR